MTVEITVEMGTEKLSEGSKQPLQRDAESKFAAFMVLFCFGHDLGWIK